MAQREVGAKTNEIPELATAIEGLDLFSWVVTMDALPTQRDAATLISEVKAGHYLMIVKGNQPTLLAQVTAALTGTDAEKFADASWADEGKGHGRRERRGIRTAPAAGIDWPGAAQVMRIRRDTGPTADHWTSKEVSYGITSLPQTWQAPATSRFTPAQRLGQSKTASTMRPFSPSARTPRKQGPAASRPPTPPSATSPSAPPARGRLREHRPRPPLLRPRRPAHPRPLRIRLNRHQEHQVTNTPGPGRAGEVTGLRPCQVVADSGMPPGGMAVAIP